MPKFIAVLKRDADDKTLQSSIMQADITYEAKNLDVAEQMITMYAVFAMPGMIIDSVYEVG